MKNVTTLLAVLAFVCASYAQTFRGGVEGTVTDSTGAAIAQAQVTAKDVGTGLTRTTQTDAQGFYFITELPLGEYEVTASKSGFRTSTIRGIHVGVSARELVNVSLQPGAVKETIEVTGEAPLVESTINNLGGTIEAKQIAELPVNGRDFVKTLTMVPGAGSDPNGDSDSPGAFGTFSINGNRGRANNYLLDGTDMNDGYRNDPDINEAGVFGTPATLLPPDALAEVAVLSNMEAEYGRNSGAVINTVTKSGTNNLHGSAFEYFRNNALDARNFFNTPPTPQNSFHNNQFGGSLGGPIIKDQTFWFVAYEGWRETGGIPNIASVPSQARLNAYLAEPTNVVSPVMTRLLARNPWGIPLPAVGDSGGPNCSGVSNPSDCNATVQVTDHFTNRVDSLILKLDHHLGGRARNDLLTARYFFGDSDQSFPLALGGGTTIPNYNTITPTRVQVLSLSYTHLFTPTLVMEVRGGWNRFAEGFFPQDSTFDPASIGWDTGVGPHDFGLPLIKFGDGTSALGANNSLPRHRFDTNWQYFTNLAYTSGKHNLKFGYEFRRTTINQFYDLNYRGKFKFSSFEDFVAGVVSSSTAAAGNSQRTTHQNNHAFYVQDNYRLTRNMTVNLGLRWDYYGVIHEQGNRFSLFDAASDSLVFVGRPGGPSELYPKDLNNFAPRVSFAYDVFGKGKTVIRGGWGLYYDAFSQDFFIGHFPFNTNSPGMAYNGIGTDAIQSGSLTNGGQITPNVPIFTFSPTTDVWTVNQKIRTPYIFNYNLNVQQALGRSMALQAGYVGSHGTKLFRFIDINQHDPATGNFPFANFNIINQFESTASSNYNSLQVSWNLRAWHGVTSQLAYTWSHSIDNASDGEDYVPNAAQPDNSLRPDLEKANSNFDARQRLSWSFIYELPNRATTKWLTNGWALDGLLRISTGQPYNLNSFENFNNSNEFFERPDVIGNPFAGTSTPFAILNLGAFAAPCVWDPNGETCASGFHFGNLRRNAFVGPDFHNFDFSISKNTKLGERVAMQLRADFFNILNHPNFSNPLMPNFLVDLETNHPVAHDPNNQGCQAILANLPPPVPCRGIGQGFLSTPNTPDVAAGYPFLGGGGPRNIQLSARFTF